VTSCSQGHDVNFTVRQNEVEKKEAIVPDDDPECNDCPVDAVEEARNKLLFVSYRYVIQGQVEEY
jgi:hypothetical protein